MHRLAEDNGTAKGNVAQCGRDIVGLTYNAHGYGFRIRDGGDRIFAYE